MSVCRLCGDFKCFEELQDIYDSESDIILKLRNTLKVELEYNKMLPNSVCLECVNNLENCNKFLELISAVQTRFEIELQQQLQMFECNYEVPNDSHEVELKNIEIKLEKLNPNKIKHSTANRRSTKQKNPQSTKENVSKKPNESKSESIASKPKQRRRIRVKKYTHIAENYQMANLFENELEGRFVVQPQDMDIGNHQKTEDGILPDEMLEKLKEISWKNYKWKCEECQEYFENVMDLEMHSLKLHKKRVVLDCCARTFRTYAKYLFHITEKHQPDLKYCCLICSEYRTSFLHLYRHIESAHSNYKILICLYCGQFHYDCYMLFRHIDEKHVPLPLLYHCDLCGESFSRRDKIIRHMTLIHTKDKQIKQKTYMCEICASNFRNSYDLRNHQKSSHSNISEEVCSYCGKASHLYKYSIRNNLFTNIYSTDV
ncbi:CLUMA_CG008456, isoform A [Clunio marinus]|uniref:CLUMA_CG008456, isoform A n=1 Tax=Clunio marinus TaxID=568069 RepID=A0A1J1I3T5_9DIPT|nr:CLUMA_CG008456, isoform A [Clunio marinus]